MKLMIDFIIETFKPDGLNVILIEVREKNKDTRDFYKNLGFIETGMRRNYYSDDNAILIEKNI